MTVEVRIAALICSLLLRGYNKRSRNQGWVGINSIMSTNRILVVDDEPGIVKTVQAYLEQEGYAVYTAIDGPAALKAARSVRPDLEDELV